MDGRGLVVRQNDMVYLIMYTCAKQAKKKKKKRKNSLRRRTDDAAIYLSVRPISRCIYGHNIYIVTRTYNTYLHTHMYIYTYIYTYINICNMRFVHCSVAEYWSQYNKCILPNGSAGTSFGRSAIVRGRRLTRSSSSSSGIVLSLSCMRTTARREETMVVVECACVCVTKSFDLRVCLETSLLLRDLS